MAQRNPKAAKKAPTNPKPGRPSTYTAKVADTICERIADGESLRSICRDESMPDKATVFRWLDSKPEFRDQYARAREEQADTLADEIVTIADEECTMVRAAKHPTAAKDDEAELEVVFDSTAVARNKLRVDARKWVAAKLKPKVYGNAVTVKGDPNNPLQVRRAQDFSDDELAAMAVTGASNG
jgi:hypothetical protein